MTKASTKHERRIAAAVAVAVADAWTLLLGKRNDGHRHLQAATPSAMAAELGCSRMQIFRMLSDLAGQTVFFVQMSFDWGGSFAPPSQP